MSDIIKAKNFSTNNISFSDVKTNKYGGKSVYVNYNGGKFRVQTPSMFLPYGLNEYEVKDEKGEVTGMKYSISMSFKGMERENDESLSSKDRANAKKLRELHEMYTALDDKLITQCLSNSMPYIKQKAPSKETVKALFNESIVLSRDKESQEPDGKWPDSIKAKVPFWEGEFKTEVYDEHKKEVPIQEYITKGSQVVLLLECTGIWFAGGKFGVGWKAVQVQVLSRPSGLKGFSIIPDSDEEDDDEDCDEVDDNQQYPLQNEVVSTDEVVDNSNKELDGGLESDSDEETDDEEEKPPTPPPNKKKKK